LVVTLHKTAGHPYRVAAGECAVIVALLAVGDISALGVAARRAAQWSAAGDLL